MVTHLILVGLLSLCSLSLGKECIRDLKVNMDFPGADIAILNSPDVEHCQQLCTQHPACLFFSFVRADWTKDDTHFYCQLKSTSSGSPNRETSLLGMTSGYSLKPCNTDSQTLAEPCLSNLYQNVDFFGADYKTLFTPDVEECRRVCTQDRACQFFTFVNEEFTPAKIRYLCRLKFSWSVPRTPTVTRMAGVTSGFSHTLQITPLINTACQNKLFPDTDIPGHDVETLPAASTEHCQTLCSASPRCTYFSYASASFSCQLKNNPNEMVTVAKQGVTSGMPVRFCQLDTSWLEVAQQGVNFAGSDIGFEMMSDADACQRACSENPNCQFYTYVDESYSYRDHRTRCYQKRTITMPAPPKVAKLNNVVSGFSLRNCAT